MATLSGTWVFNETLTTVININQAAIFQSAENQYARFAANTTNDELYYDNNLVSDNSGDLVYNCATSTWTDEAYRIVDFSSTSQAVSKEFYEWFTANAKPIITDLKGYTVTVPAYWSALSGYGLYSLEGSISLPSQSSNVDLVNVDGYSFGVGYDYDYSDSAWYSSPDICCSFVVFRDETATAQVYRDYVYDPTQTIILNITGGTHSSSLSLIQWLYDNNATFEKTGGEEEPTTPHGEIYYKGNLVATIVEGETIVLHTKDFKFLGDIVIKNVRGGIISFTIDGVTYYAEEGMTWEEWVASEYNTNQKYNFNGDWQYIVHRSNWYYVYNTNTNAYASKGNGDLSPMEFTIVANGVYATKFVEYGGGGND